ncbi:MAG: hypothetical protein WEB90_03250 [Gemmatimonadota bacterium]
MGFRANTKVVAGIFDDEAAAGAAVERLVAEHFDPSNDLNVIASHHHERQTVPIWRNLPVIRDSAIGAAAGAILVGAGVALAGLSFGPLTLTPGVLAAVLESAFAGGSLGFAFGALLGLGHAKTETRFDVTNVHDGVIWVGVTASGSRALRAREILADAGARHFLEREPDVSTPAYQPAA